MVATAGVFSAVSCWYGFMFGRESARKELGDLIESLRRDNSNSSSSPLAMAIKIYKTMLVVTLCVALLLIRRGSLENPHACNYKGTLAILKPQGQGYVTAQLFQGLGLGKTLRRHIGSSDQSAPRVEQVFMIQQWSVTVQHTSESFRPPSDMLFTNSTKCYQNLIYLLPEPVHIHQHHTSLVHFLRRLYLLN
ncbi:hypothetical protein V6N11_009576 [Hibiscus sabdariffa]|uniref:Uncharacterized protein n=1 Tax=Hibiscus sabdariffa TaxID=183260 RepID=A0ABR2P679_9ROSI